MQDEGQFTAVPTSCRRIPTISGAKLLAVHMGAGSAAIEKKLFIKFGYAETVSLYISFKLN